MADDTATPRSVRDIIDENLKEEQNPANPNFETALLNFHKYKAQVDDLVQEASKLDEETKHLTFGREEDYEAFKKATAAASAYRDKHYKVSTPIEWFFRNGDIGDWFRCQLEGCRVFLEERFFDKIFEAREKQYGEGDAMKKWAELPLAKNPYLPPWEAVKDD